MEKVFECAKAKINLTLDIVGRKGNYHLLDMVVASISLADEVEISSRNDKKCLCFMDGAPVDESNSAIRACKMMQQQFFCNGFDIIITKKIPYSGGLGGSTADGVAVIKGIAKILDIPRNKISNDFLIGLGSDAPCMYDDGLKRVRGLGEIVDKLDYLPKYNIGIIGGTGVSTPQCYAKFDQMKLSGGSASLKVLHSLEKGELDFYKYFSNDLTLPAIALNPEIANAMEAMTKAHALKVNMSGSGSAVYGLFEGEPPSEYINTTFK